MERLIDVASYPVLPVLDKLLQNKSTKKNIIWATDTYASFGNGFQDTDQIDRTLLLQHADVIRPRIRKSMEDQAQRTRKKAEVFTPAWVCNEMNNVCDEDWFHRKNVFNTPQEDHSWVPTEGKIELPKRKRWQCYVDSRRLEITCGEAPYLCSRYDASTGERIEPLNRRIGIVDRKLRVVNENTQTREEWVKWAVRALDASYGYEYQGDNVLIARVNLYLTFIDYYKERWGEIPPGKLLRKIANRIAWNIWQMDGLKDIVPTGKPYEEFHQMTFGELFSSDWEEAERKMEEAVAIPAVTYNWRSKLSVLFRKVKEKTMKALQGFLRPEFLNRVDEIITFNHLTEENFLGIADIMLKELQDSLSTRGLSLFWDDDLRRLLVKKAYSVTYGARNLRRTIQKELEDPISEAIIDSFEHPISAIRIRVEGETVKLDIT